MKDAPYKIYLTEDELPTRWYNLRADMKNKPAPMLNPATKKPVTFEDLRPVFCDELIRQELNETDAFIDIPDEVLAFYKMYRPSPLVHAEFLERALNTPAKIYYLLLRELLVYLVPRLGPVEAARRVLHADRELRVAPGNLHARRLLEGELLALGTEVVPEPCGSVPLVVAPA